MKTAFYPQVHKEVGDGKYARRCARSCLVSRMLNRCLREVSAEALPLAVWEARGPWAPAHETCYRQLKTDRTYIVAV